MFSATGCVGKLVAEYLARNYADLSYALAGRNREKLLRLCGELRLPSSVGIEEARVEDESSMRALVCRSKVLFNLAGP